MRKQGLVANQRLIEARLEKCWSQEEAASECGVGDRSYRRWENGESYPSLASLRLLKEGFGCSAADLGYEHLTRLEPVIDEEEATSQRASVVVTLTTEQVTVLSSLLQGGRMDKARRKTLQTILTSLGTATTIPLVSGFEPWERLITGKPTDIDTATLVHFESLVDACAGLSNRNQLDTAEQILLGFLPRLIHLSPHNSKVASLASRCVQLESILVAHRLKISDKVTRCQQAVSLAKMAKDTNVLVASLLELGVAYQYQEKPMEALQSYQEALFFCKDASPVLRARTYAEAGAALAKNGRGVEAMFYLGLAYDTLPDHPEEDPFFAISDYCGHGTLSLYHGIIYLELGQPTDAWKGFEKYKSSPSNGTVPERIRLEIVNHQGRAAILSKDMDKYVLCLEDGIAGAIALKSKKRFDEANTIFHQEVPISWLREAPIKQIMERYRLDHRNASA